MLWYFVVVFLFLTVSVVFKGCGYGSLFSDLSDRLFTRLSFFLGFHFLFLPQASRLDCSIPQSQFSRTIASLYLTLPHLSPPISLTYQPPKITSKNSQSQSQTQLPVPKQSTPSLTRHHVRKPSSSTTSRDQAPSP